MKVRKKKDPVLWALTSSEDLAGYMAARDYLLENGREEEVPDLELEMECFQLLLYFKEAGWSFGKERPKIDGRNINWYRGGRTTYWLRIENKWYFASRKEEKIAEYNSDTKLYGIQMPCLRNNKPGYMRNLAQKMAAKVKKTQEKEIKDKEAAEKTLQRYLGE
jgi:hypothetical protein